ncbi:hypothetical protein CTZ27_02900 [Streptomyces griseocarneus]|nr:hypothetical protein CTZ27_02900 [Streptomyces griseocarneus]
MFVAVLLWVLDAVVGFVVLLAGLGATDFNMFEPDPHASMTPVFTYGTVFAGVVLATAAGLHRWGYRVSVWGQIAAAAALALCAAGLSGRLTL